MMNWILAANWAMLVAFAVGTALGLTVGWVLRSWREPDAARAQPDVADAPPPAARAEVPARTWKRHEAARPESSTDLSTALAPDEQYDPLGPAILLVDDRLEMLGIHAAYLRKHGYRTLLADNGTTGLAFARAYHPALIVLDHSMPDRSGVEVARELKADPATANIPILLMTALSYGAVGAAAMEAGCEAFLPKPIEPSRLLREIEARAPRH